MADDMLHVMEWHNGEMKRRQSEGRGWMAKNNLDAALFTSCHCINYYSGWLYCYFGRKYGMVITDKAATTISAGIDGGQLGGAALAATSPIPTGGATTSIARRDNSTWRCELTPKRKLLFFFYSSLFLRAIRLLSKTSAGVR